MTFLYPLGLLGLIGIPILIIIYIIKNKYTEQTVSSTYLWILSERFLKRKNPLSRLSGLVSLILQILMITFISLAIAHPVITVPGAANEYCFILDGSGSMQIRQGDHTRFDAAKQKVAELIDDSVDGSRFSLIYAGDSTTVVYEKLGDKELALEMLNDIGPSYSEGKMTEAIGKAQAYFSESPSILTYLVTDTEHLVNENIRLINVAGEEKNLGVGNIAYNIADGKINVVGDLTAFSNATDGEAVAVRLYVDGAETPAAETQAVVFQGEPARFQLTCDGEYFESLRVVAQTEDDLTIDDETVIYNVQADDSYTVLLVSNWPLFLKSALRAVGHNNITAVTPSEYNELYANSGGFGLYIFESYTPDVMPKDGAVWVINPKKSSNDAGFSVQDIVDIDGPGKLDITTSSTSLAKQFTDRLERDDVYLSSFVKCGLYRNFTTIYSYNGIPVVFAGTNAHGNREVVFAFDLHNSTLPMMYDFVVMISNCLKYSFPAVVEDVNLYVGDTARINVLANCESIRVDSPLKNVTYLALENATSDLLLKEAGVYTITATVAGQERVFRLHAALPEAERQVVASSQEISLQGEAQNGGFDGEYNPLPILFIILALIFVADWGVYCYEKYQLR